MTKHQEVKQGVIFPIGEKNEAYAQYFIGQSYLQSLVADAAINVGVANVTGGEGWYQEEDKAPQFLQAGDVIVTHDGVKHWHGAAKDSWFEHIAITAGTPEWLEPVSDEWYDKLEK